MKKGMFVSFPDLRPSHMSILQGLDESALLQQVVTSLAIDGSTMTGCFFRSLIRKFPAFTRGAERRILPSFLEGKVKAVPLKEIIRLLCSRFNRNEVLTHRVWRWAEMGFDNTVARKYAGRFECVYGMEHSSLETFVRQKKAGGLCFLRQVMAHGREVAAVFKRLMEEFPQYKQTPYVKILMKDLNRILQRKEAEYQQADLIIANSDYVKQSFLKEGINSKKVISIPTGCPPCVDRRARAGRGEEPLIFLYAGTLSLRKGIPYLLEAWRKLKAQRSAELWLVGKNELLVDLLTLKQEGVKFFEPVSYMNLAKIYEKADVLVFPTLLEGLAHVILEALSFGLPIITTKESGCGDFVKNELNGFIIPSANTEALLNAMSWCLDNQRKLPEMSESSHRTARQWTVYDSNKAHLKVIEEFLKNRGVV